MKKITFLYVTLSVFILVTSCKPKKTVDFDNSMKINISRDWKFKTGDSMQWAKTAYNDKDWTIIGAGAYWEQQGFQAYDGMAWYRKKVFFPDSLKDELTEKYKFVSINLGKIDDSNEFYFNGQLVGKTGSMADHLLAAYDSARVYQIPAELIKWEEANQLAIRIADFTGNGGLYRGEYFMYPSFWKDFIELQPVIDGQQGIFNDKETAHPAVKFINNSQETLTGNFICQITTDAHEELKKINREFSIKKEITEEFEIPYQPQNPGFYHAEFQFILPEKKDTLIKTVKFGVAPTRIASPPDLPDDFKAYWDKARKELDAVKPAFNIVKNKAYSSIHHNVYLVEMKSLGDVLIRGWYSVPNKPGKFPAILKSIGYGGNMPPDTTYDEFAVLAMNIRGHGNSRDDIKPDFPGYLLYGIEDKETYIYRGAYMDCVRGIDFLVSRSEVDSSRIAAKGGSQGGALSFAVSALDDRVKLCVPHIPFLSDFKDYFKIASWPTNEFEEYVQENQETSWDDIYNVLAYIDIKNLSTQVDIPVLMGVGLLDQVCPPHTNFAAYNNSPSKDKEYRVYKNFGHAIPQSHRDYEIEWLKVHFGM